MAKLTAASSAIPLQPTSFRAAGLPDAQRESERIFRKIAWRIVPLVLVGYIIAYLDRVNVGFAKLQFTQDLSFNDAVYGLGAGLFFAGYLLFEVPSNLLLERIGARLTLARIMILWGVISAGMAFVSTPMQFYIGRFVLGMAEAGFFPGIILYLSYWFPAERRGRITSMFVMGASIAGIIGSPLSGWLMGLDGLHGLRGWQVLFIYEGLPAALLGVCCLFYVDDEPKRAKWLTDAEKRVVAAALEAENSGGHAQREATFRKALLDPRLYVLALAYLSILAGTQAVALWTPTLLNRFGIGTSLVGVVGAVPFVIAVVGMLLLGRSSDRHLERRWHFAGAIWLGGACLAAFALVPNFLITTTLLLGGVAGGSWAALAVFWTIPPALLLKQAKAGGIALISSAGAIGGFVSPVIIGWSSSLTGSLYGGFAVVGGMLLVSGVIILVFTRSATTTATAAA